MTDRYQIRNTLVPAMPQIAVTEIFPDGTGRDVCWCYKLSMARKLIRLLNQDTPQRAYATAQPRP